MFQGTDSTRRATRFPVRSPIAKESKEAKFQHPQTQHPNLFAGGRCASVEPLKILLSRMSNWVSELCQGCGRIRPILGPSKSHEVGEFGRKKGSERAHLHSKRMRSSAESLVYPS